MTCRELLAIVYFTRQYHHFLLGCKFMIPTDHSSLAWLMRFHRIQGQLARWIEELSQFDMQILHCQGRKLSNADALSRIPDLLDPCDWYQAGTDVKDLKCAGCPYCTRAHHQWSRFDLEVDDVVPLSFRTPTVAIQMLLIYLLFYVTFNSQGHIATGSLQVEETSAYCTVNHWASASNYRTDSNRRPPRLEARTLTATPPSPLDVIGV